MGKVRDPRPSVGRRRGPVRLHLVLQAELGKVSPYVSVMLFKTEPEARGAIDRIDEEVCGGSCRNDHKLVRITK